MQKKDTTGSLNVTDTIVLVMYRIVICHNKVYSDDRMKVEVLRELNDLRQDLMLLLMPWYHVGVQITNI